MMVFNIWKGQNSLCIYLEEEERRRKKLPVISEKTLFVRWNWGRLGSLF